MRTAYKISHFFILIYGALRDLVPFVQFKNVKNTHGGVLFLVKFTEINTPPWVFFTFLKLYNCTKSRNAPHMGLKDEKIAADLPVKPTDGHQYLHFSSSHPNHT